MSFAMRLLRVRARQSASGPAGCDLRTTRNSSIGWPAGSVNCQIPDEAHLGLPVQLHRPGQHEPRPGEHRLRGEVVRRSGGPQRRQAAVGGREPTDPTHRRRDQPPAGRALGDPVTELDRTVGEVDQVDPPDHPADAVDAVDQDGRSPGETS